jgi:hypothetical protein
MPRPTPFPIEFDLAGTRDTLDVIERVVRGVRTVLEGIKERDRTIERIPARVELPVWDEDDGNFSGGCNPKGFVGWQDDRASDVLARLTPYLHALLRALETSEKLPTRISEILKRDEPVA